MFEHDYCKQRAADLLEKKNQIQNNLLEITPKVNENYISYNGKPTLVLLQSPQFTKHKDNFEKEIRHQVNTNLNYLMEELDKIEPKSYFPPDSQNFKKSSINYWNSGIYHLVLLELLIDDLNLAHEHNSQSRTGKSNNDYFEILHEYKSKTLLITMIEKYQFEKIISNCLMKLYSSLTLINLQLSTQEYYQARKDGSIIKTSKLNKKEEQTIIDLLVRTLCYMDHKDPSSRISQRVIPKNIKEFIKQHKLSQYEYYAICILELWNIWPIFNINDEVQFVEKIIESVNNTTKKHKLINKELEKNNKKTELKSIEMKEDLREKVIIELGTKALLKKNLEERFSSLSEEQNEQINSASLIECNIWLDYCHIIDDINKLLKLTHRYGFRFNTSNLKKLNKKL